MGNRLSGSQPGGRRPVLKEPGSRQETLTPKSDKCHKFNASRPGDGPFVSHGSGSDPFVTHAIKLNHRLSAENPAGLKGKRTRRHKNAQFQNASARYTSVVIRLADASGYKRISQFLPFALTCISRRSLMWTSEPGDDSPARCGGRRTDPDQHRIRNLRTGIGQHRFIQPSAEACRQDDGNV